MRQVLAADEGTECMKEIAAAVQEGANAYLARQLRTLGVFAVVVFFLLMLLPADTLVAARRDVRCSSWSARFLGGHRLHRHAARRTQQCAGRRGRARGDTGGGRAGGGSHGRLAQGMKIAFRTGGVVGMFTVGLGLLGASCVVLVYAADAPKVLEGFGFGAALIAMFMRVGGGIFTKAADVGADLVGKVEQGIPEDDPRNAATIADNVGDNVGDCAGMAADLFESYAVTLVAALILGKAAFGDSGLAFPLLVPAIGVLTAMIGIFAVAPRRADRSGMTRHQPRILHLRGDLARPGGPGGLPLPAVLVRRLDGVTEREILGHGGDPRVFALVAVAIGIVLAAADPAAHRLLHRDHPAPGQGHRQDAR